MSRKKIISPLPIIILFQAKQMIVVNRDMDKL
jgi:hypothetical protein